MRLRNVVIDPGFGRIAVLLPLLLLTGATFAQAEPESVATGKVGASPEINAKFVDPELDVDSWVARFEVESREVFAARDEVLQAMRLKRRHRVADIGAGTGLFTRLFAGAVPKGWVYAVDIGPRFLEHINETARDQALDNVTAVLGRTESVALPAASVDVVFVCDTYHHFETPSSTLASIRRALAPGGQLIIVDFERIEGQTREWLMDHVRAGKDVFRAEIEAAGFAFVEEVEIPAFEENYFLRFRRR